MYEHIFASILGVAAFLSPIEENLLLYKHLGEALLMSTTTYV